MMTMMTMTISPSVSSLQFWQTPPPSISPRMFIDSLLSATSGSKMHSSAFPWHWHFSHSKLPVWNGQKVEILQSVFNLPTDMKIGQNFYQTTSLMFLHNTFTMDASLLKQRSHIHRTRPDTLPISSRWRVGRSCLQMGRGSLLVGRGCILGGQGLLCSEITKSANFAPSKISCDGRTDVGR